MGLLRELNLLVVEAFIEDSDIARQLIVEGLLLLTELKLVKSEDTATYTLMQHQVEGVIT